MSMRTDRGDTLLRLLFPVALLASFVSHLPGARLLFLAMGPLALAVLVLTPGRRLLDRRLPVPLVLFLAWAAASLLWSADPPETVRALAELAVYAALGLAAGLLLPLPQLHRSLSVVARILLVATVVSLVVAPEWATAPAEDEAPGWHGPFSHKNGLGAFLVLATATLWFDRHRRRAPWLVLVAVLLVGTQSSTAVALVLVVAALLLWQRGLESLRGVQARGLYLGVSLVALLTLVAAAVRRPDLVTSVLGRSGTLSGRTEIWAAVARQVEERPLLGHGWGGVWRETSLPTLEIWREVRFEAFYAHNGYLDLLLQVGVVGLALLLLVVLPAAGSLWRHRDDDLAFWGFLVVVTSLLAAFSESSPLTGSGLVLLIALVTAARQRELRRRPADVPAALRGPEVPDVPAGAAGASERAGQAGGSRTPFALR